MVTTDVFWAAIGTCAALSGALGFLVCLLWIVLLERRRDRER